MQKQMNPVFISAPQLAARLAISRTTLWRYLRDDPTFPKPVRFGRQTRRWSLASVEDWLNTRRP